MTTREQKIRMGLAGIAISCCYLMIVIKILWIQIRQHQFLHVLAEKQYDTVAISIPPRAAILDRHGAPLTHTVDHLSAFVVPRQLSEPDTLAAWLEQHGCHDAVARIAARPHAAFCFVQRHLADNTIKEWQVDPHPDITFLREPGRCYTLPCASHLIGITTIDNEGAFGIEKMYDERLKGTPRRCTFKRDARTRHTFFFERHVADEGHDGSPARLTIDSTLQFMAYQEIAATATTLGAVKSAAIILDPTTGEILACAQWPGFDPHDTGHLSLDHTQPWPIIHAFELGSVIKMFLALAALAEGVVTPDTLIDCRNTTSTTINGMRINTWAPHGIMPFRDVIAYSNNVGTAQVAEQLGTKIYDHYVRCGLCAPSGLAWPGEPSGFVTHPSTWCKQSIASLSYGYEVRISLLQLACAYAMIINGGVPIAPRIVMELPRDRKARPEQCYDAAITETLHEMLERTVREGTARKAGLKGYHVCGKTGSARILRNGAYQEGRNIFTFVGHVKLDAYERIIVTCIYEPRSSKLFASQTAAPLFERIAERMIIHEQAISKESCHDQSGVAAAR